MKTICKIISTISLCLNVALVWAIVNDNLTGILAFVILVFATLINMLIAFFTGYVDGTENRCKHKTKQTEKKNGITETEKKNLFETFGV